VAVWAGEAPAQTARPAGSEALKQESKQLPANWVRAEMERDTLKNADYIFATDGPMKRFAFIALNVSSWPVREQCRLLAVSFSDYYV
jgi:hypothetical protein